MPDQHRPSSFLHRFMVPIGLTIAGIVVETVNWTTNIMPEKLLPKYGTSSQAVFGQMFGALIAALLLIWLLFTRQVTWVRKGLVFGAVGLLATGLWLCIREIENTGNNNLVIRFRWEPTQDERLAAYQSQVNQQPTERALDCAAPQFTNFLGTNRDGQVPWNGMATDLGASPPREVWRRPMGGGYAGCVISGGLAVTIEQRGEEEVVVALDMRTGADLWTRSYPGHFKESLGGNGPRATPTISGSDLFALGASGLLVSLDLATGKENWNTNILEDAGAKNIQWGMSGAPLVTDHLVIVNPGGTEGNGVLAYDRSGGQRIWAAGNNKAGYSSPVLTELCGTKQVLIFDAAGVAGYEIDSGIELWRYPFSTFSGINVAQPLALPGDQVFVSAGYDSGCLLLQIQSEAGQWTAEPVWKNKNLKSKMSSAVYRAGYLYGLDDGILCCLDAASGKRQWKKGRYGHGQLLLSGEILVMMGEAGNLVLVAANPVEHRELSLVPLLPGGKTWNAPALADNQLLLRNHFEAVLLELAVVR